MPTTTRAAPTSIDLSKVSFGATGAVTSCLALMIGLTQIGVTKNGLLGALLVVGLADNIADSLGIHVYSESRVKGYSHLHTITNYATRACVTLAFIAFVFFLPLQAALAASVAVGLSVIAALSYFIAKTHGIVPGRAVAEHVVIAVLVLIVSLLVGSSIRALLPA